VCQLKHTSVLLNLLFNLSVSSCITITKYYYKLSGKNITGKFSFSLSKCFKMQQSVKFAGLLQDLYLDLI